MLQIKDVRKKYVTGDLVQTALDGVSLNLRKSELVAILGPSGSGKSTLLNVIGGLDHYDSGDLIIDGISTKKYTDRDWDSYRNHTIGFVFQSYNLIPHQTVLANVELALTISGIPHSQRRKRAVEALEKVGLGNQIHKKPSQMSGGQMQRVAIARALVNNPKILLADEPTGALDSQTSIQVMDLLKEVSKDRLVVMVTHNPELAEQYADRIVRVKDGKIIGDSNPYTVEESTQEAPVHKNMGKSSMSLFSSLSLSFNNLKSKKGRTLLTSFAGSIGIIGIALIMALSAGFQGYMDSVQEDTLANNPLTIQSQTADIISALYPANTADPNGSASGSIVEEHPTLSNIMNHIGANDLGSFKTHLENNWDKIGSALNAVQYDYNIQPLIYSAEPDVLRQINPACLFQKITGNDLISAIMDVNAFSEMVPNEKMLDSQYEMLQGHWPQNYNELVFVLPAPNQLSDHLAYTLGMKELDSLEKMIELLMNGETVLPQEAPMEWSYDDLMSMKFKLVSAPDLYRFNSEYGIWENMSENTDYMKALVASSEELKVVGIVCPKDGSSAATLSPGLAYHADLTRHIMDTVASSQIVKDQLSNPEINVFSGKPFDYQGEDGPIDLEDMISVDADAISAAIGVNINNSDLAKMLEKYLNEITNSVQVDSASAEKDFIYTLSQLMQQMLTEFVSANRDDTGAAKLHLKDVSPMVDAFLQSEFAGNALQNLSTKYSLSTETFTEVYKPLMLGLLTGHIAHESTLDPQAMIDSLTPAAETTAETAGTQAPTAAPTDSSAPTVPEEPLPGYEDLFVMLKAEDIPGLVKTFEAHPVTLGACTVMGKKMMEPAVLQILSEKVAEFGKNFAECIGDSFYIDKDKLMHAFKFNMSEDELKRLLDAVTSQTRQRSAETNLSLLGYADPSQPAAIYFYMSNFDGKERFLDFIHDYNESMEQSGQEDKVIRFTDFTGIMMSSINTIIETVSYALIAFVAVSLLVSSIMIGIITYISVMERTKEIGVLRAIGASKGNISQVFNAETFIIGLGSGLMGIVFSLILLIPGNYLIHTYLNEAITARLPVVSGIILILVSMLLTLLGGLIPAKQAAKKDPVIALRSE